MKVRKELGDWGERLAADYLRRQGYVIRETNFRCPLGEIDIVAEKGEHLVFVEVRTRRGRNFGTPEESVTSVKAERLIDLAHTYLQSHDNLPPFWRIDFVAVELTPAGKILRLELIENAVSDRSEHRK
jgi:putative endonuclease